MAAERELTAYKPASADEAVGSPVHAGGQPFLNSQSVRSDQSRRSSRRESESRAVAVSTQRRLLHTSRCFREGHAVRGAGSDAFLVAEYAP